MALRDQVKKKRSASKSKPAAKSRTTAPAAPAAAPPTMAQPQPMIPDVYEYVRSIANIPGLRKTGPQ